VEERTEKWGGYGETVGDFHADARDLFSSIRGFQTPKLRVIGGGFQTPKLRVIGGD
jgi:hypothetical protein